MYTIEKIINMTFVVDGITYKSKRSYFHEMNPDRENATQNEIDKFLYHNVTEYHNTKSTFYREKYRTMKNNNVRNYKRKTHDDAVSESEKCENSDESILERIKTFLQMFRVERTNEPLSIASKLNYTTNIKTMMKRMDKNNLDFLVNDIQGVINFLNETDSSIENRSQYHARLSSRNFFTVAVNFLPLANTNDQNNRVIAKCVYNQWLQDHSILIKPNKRKDYGMSWIDTVKMMQRKIKKTKNDLHKLILSLYTDVPPRRSMDYTNMLINQPDDKKSNILVFTPEVKQFIFNKYKTVNKSGVQTIHIKSPELINVISNYLDKHKNQKFLLMRNANALNDTQIANILRTEIGSKTQKFGIQAIRRMFATYIVIESKRNPRLFESFAKKMGTSVSMLMNNYVQVNDDELDYDNTDYHGV